MLVRRGRLTGSLVAASFVAQGLASSACARDPAVLVSPLTGDAIAAGETVAIHIDDGDDRPGGEKLTPQLWIEESFAGATQNGRPDCAQRALRLGQAGILDPATRDFNMLHVAALTATGIHVLDPRGGLRGARSLAFVDLGGRPERMVWSDTTGLLWVTLPGRNAVAAVDVGSWSVARTIEAGGAPSDIIEIAPGREAVLASDAGGSRVVFNGDVHKAVTLPATATRLSMAKGGELVAHGAGYIMVIDGTVAKTMSAGLRETRFVEAAEALFGLDDKGHPAFVTLDGESGPVSRAEGMRFERMWAAPDGRVLVAWDPAGDAIAIVDPAARAVIRTIPADRPRSIAASDNSLFVRTAGRGETMVLPYSGLLEGEPIAPRYIAGGDLPSPARASLPVTATEEGISAWVDTERGQIYVYHEGMNIPSATIRLPDPTTSDLALIGPLVRPAGKTGFDATARLDAPGEYVAIAKGIEPRYTVCNTFTVAGGAAAQQVASTWRVELQPPSGKLVVGRPAEFAIDLRAEPAEAADFADTVGFLLMEGSGLDQRRLLAHHRGEGHYVAAFSPTRPGIFLLMADKATLPARTAGRLVTTVEIGEDQ